MTSKQIRIYGELISCDLDAEGNIHIIIKKKTNHQEEMVKWIREFFRGNNISMCIYYLREKHESPILP